MNEQEQPNETIENTSTVTDPTLQQQEDEARAVHEETTVQSGENGIRHIESDKIQGKHGHETDSEVLIEKLEENNVRDEIKVEPLFESKDNGRPTNFTKKLSLDIRRMILEGETYKQIQETLSIPAGTWTNWYWLNQKAEDDSSQCFRDFVNSAKEERMVRSAEEMVATLVYAEDDRVKLNASTFLLETLGKAKYSKRTEQTGANGEPLSVSVVRYADNNTTLPIRTEKLPSSDSQSV